MKRLTSFFVFSFSWLITSNLSFCMFQNHKRRFARRMVFIK